MSKIFNEDGTLYIPISGRLKLPKDKIIEAQGKAVVTEAYCQNGHSLISDVKINEQNGLNFIYTNQEREKEAEKARKEQQNKLNDLIKGASPQTLNDPNFKNLTDEQKIFVLYNEKILKEDNEDKARKMDEALDEAIAQAEPYFQQELKVVPFYFFI